VKYNNRQKENSEHNKCVSRTDTNPPFGQMDPRGGRGTSAVIVPIRIKFGVDPSTRCWDIAQKPPKCKNSPLTPIVMKISFPPFSAPGTANPQRGEDTPGTTVRPHAKFVANRPAGCRKIVDKKANKQKKTYSKTNTSPFALTSKWRVITRQICCRPFVCFLLLVP